MQFKLLGRLLPILLFMPLVGVNAEPNQNESFSLEMERANRAYGHHDLPDAMAILKTIAEKGYAPAQYKLAYFLDYGERNEEATGWYKKAAEAGHLDAQMDLAQKYVNGEGVDADVGKAISWLERAAAQNSTHAMMILAGLHVREGSENMDYEKAVYWYKKAFETGEKQGAANIYEAYRDGRLGLEQSPEKANEWLIKWQGEPLAEEVKHEE